MSERFWSRDTDRSHAHPTISALGKGKHVDRGYWQYLPGRRPGYVGFRNVGHEQPSAIRPTTCRGPQEGAEISPRRADLRPGLRVRGLEITSRGNRKPAQTELAPDAAIRPVSRIDQRNSARPAHAAAPAGQCARSAAASTSRFPRRRRSAGRITISVTISVRDWALASAIPGPPVSPAAARMRPVRDGRRARGSAAIPPGRTARRTRCGSRGCDGVVVRCSGPRTQSSRRACVVRRRSASGR